MILKSASEVEPFVFNDAILDSINTKNLGEVFNLPLEVSTGIDSKVSIDIVFRLDKKRDVLDVSKTTQGGGTIESNAPTDFQDLITGIYFHSSGGNDSIEGSQFNDFIRAGGGDDQIISGEGDDLIRSGAGSDVISTGGGIDTVYYTVDQIDGSVDTITDFSREDVIKIGPGIEVASQTSEQLILSSNSDGVMSTVSVLFSGLDSSQVIF